jgi:hypothetical protein
MRKTNEFGELDLDDEFDYIEGEDLTDTGSKIMATLHSVVDTIVSQSYMDGKTREKKMCIDPGEYHCLFGRFADDSDDDMYELEITVTAKWKERGLN